MLLLLLPVMQTGWLWTVCALAALCAAQDVFSDVSNTVVNNARVLSVDTTDDQSFNTLAVVNGHVCEKKKGTSHTTQRMDQRG